MQSLWNVTTFRLNEVITMKDMEIYHNLSVTPKEAQKTIAAGRLKGFTDINPMWRIQKLTEMFGPCGFGWWYEITDKQIVPGANGEMSAFVFINLYITTPDGVSKPIQGVGGSSFVSKETKGLYTSDECFKMALTDAIGTACKSLGMSADIYFSKSRTKYNALQEEPVNYPTDEHIIALLNLAKQKGVTEAQLKKKYNCSDLHKLPMKFYLECIKGLENMGDVSTT